MPLQTLPMPTPDLDGLDQAADTAPTPTGMAMMQTADFGGLTRRLLGASGASDADAFDDQVQRMTGQSFRLDPDEANARFGIPGALAFKAPVTEEEAAFKQNETQRRLFQSDVLSRSSLNPLQSIGASMAGGLLDPTSIPLMFAPEMLGLRTGVEGLLLGKEALAAGETVAKASRVVNGVRGAVAGGVEGMAGMTGYEAVNYPTQRFSGNTDYTPADSLTQIVLGGVLGMGFGGVHGLFFGEHAAADAAKGVLNVDDKGPPDGAPPKTAPEPPVAPLDLGPRRGPAIPPEIAALPPESRMAAVVKAIDDLADDRPTDVGQMIDAELARDSNLDPAGMSGMADPADGSPGALRARLITPSDQAPEIALTPKGQEIPVRSALVEMGDLTLSGDPQDVPAGAPIADKNGLVESGNGQIAALRRSADAGSPTYGRYVEGLKAQGYDVSGFQRPVLVRLRAEPLSDDARVQIPRDGAPAIAEKPAKPPRKRAAPKGGDAAPAAAAPTNVASAILDATAQRFVGGDAAADRARLPAADLHAPAAERTPPAPIDLRAESVERPEVDDGKPPVTETKPAGDGEAPGEPAPKAAGRPDPVAADPVLKALAADNDLFASVHGLDVEPFKPDADPKVMAEAIRAAAICIAEDL